MVILNFVDGRIIFIYADAYMDPAMCGEVIGWPR